MTDFAPLRPGEFDYLQRKKPDCRERALWHDYRSRCIYMITVTAEKGMPRLSYIQGQHNHPAPGSTAPGSTAPGCTAPGSIAGCSPAGGIQSARVELTPYGEVVDYEIINLRTFFPHILILERVIMPDHAHFVIFVREEGRQSLGEIIGTWKQKCRLKLKDCNLAYPSINGESRFFTPGFNDRIVYRTGQKEAFVNYVRQNPVRAVIRREHPEFFRNVRGVEIEGVRIELYGNFTLLQNPVVSPVVVSRRYTDQERRRWYATWDETMRSRGVLTSAFISAKEKAVLDRGLECGACAIKIQWEGFSERGKPTGRNFELCAQGRLLIISLHPYSTRTSDLTRQQCLEMNDFAHRLALPDVREALCESLHFI
ncbi:MAG: hypothetical protein PUA94_02825 [Bacteroidales bacterium]|nr:hypothetical protein [Bacteroidales bacterium]